MRLHLLWALFASICLAALPLTPASAQATRTWVSGVGDDANPCSRTAPCKTFAGAISKTATAGEINCLDPGGFGAVTITKSISIICQAGTAGVLVAGTPGITVNLGTGARVILDGLDLEEVGSGTNGVQMTGAGLLIIRNSSIRDFTGFGVLVAGPTATPAPRVVIQNSLITGNGGGGINVTGVSGSTNNAEVSNSLVDSNKNFNIQVAGPSTLVLSASALTGTSPTSIIVSGGGSLISYGNNVLRNGGAPTSTVPLQ